MFKQGFLAFIATAVAVSASPTATSPKLVPSTKFSGNIADVVVGSHNLLSSAGSSLEKRQYGSYDGTVYLCGVTDCASDCYAISTQGAGAYNQCLFTVPNPFYSVFLANPSTGYYYPFYVGINIGPTACPDAIADITQANTCYNVSPEGNGWALESGDIAAHA